MSGLLAGTSACVVQAEKVLFADDFKAGLEKGWTWVREDRNAWRTSPAGLELRVLPGNLWGPPNNAKNVLVRPVPKPGPEGLEISVTVRNQPTEQYEQVNLVWYYDDSHMVKIGLEQVDKKLCVVMGREEKDRTRTIALIRKGTPTLGLRFVVRGETIRGYYRPEGGAEWVVAGECALPVNGEPKVSLQAYQGPGKVERWALLKSFRIRRAGARK